jgi:phosphoglycolate phosphatase-like HAD superfamily hydrolase
MSYKLAIFDWNGTLIDDSFANHAGANAEFKFLGVPEISLEHYRETMDFPFIHCFNRNGVDTDTYLKNRDALQEVFMSVYEPLQKTAPLRQGAMELLNSLLDSGLDLIVLSNHIQSHLEQQMADRHVHGKFKIISGNSDISSNAAIKLSKLDRLQKILTENNYTPQECFIIGDSLEEPTIAKHLGMMCISITGGCFAEHRLRKTSTNHVVHSLSEVYALLDIRKVA